MAGARALHRAARGASFLPERAGQIKTAHHPRRGKPEDDSGSERGRDGKRQHTPTDGYVIEVGQALGNKSKEKFSGAEKNGKPCDAAEQEEQQTLSQELAEETRSLSSQRLPNRDLTPSRVGPGKQEI